MSDTILDLLQGAEAIAEFCRQCGLPMTAKKVFHWREAGKLPVGKVGGHLIASKSAIRQFLVDAATKAIPPYRR
jgi:hypothetical protein